MKYTYWSRGWCFIQSSAPRGGKGRLQRSNGRENCNENKENPQCGFLPGQLARADPAALTWWHVGPQTGQPLLWGPRQQGLCPLPASLPRSLSVPKSSLTQQRSKGSGNMKEITPPKNRLRTQGIKLSRQLSSK